MLAALSKSVFSVLAGSRTLTRLASRYGLRTPTSFARRFVAGEHMDDAIQAARRLEAQGLTATLDLLGESVTSPEAAARATDEYVRTIAAIESAGIGRNISLKLTQLGLDVDKATAIDNLRRILDRAAAADTFVRVDMEGSQYTAATLDVFETLWGIGYRNAGVVVQAALRRSPADLERLVALGARVRLVKGAYREPRDVAFQLKAEVDAAFRQLTDTLLERGVYPAIATHDPAMIDHAKARASALGLGRDRFEFQMLYGIRRDLHRRLADEGYRFRVYVPYGTEWFPYFMRRLGERPANVGFVVRSLGR
jgi:proline dehydrogenase